MDVSRPRKILRVLYLYMTIPLLLLTAVLAMTALTSGMTKKKGHDMQQWKDVPVGSGSAEMPSHPTVPVALPEEEATSSSSTGTAAIVTAIMAGITGLLGAITQTLVAFYKMKERRSGSRSE